MTTVTLSSLSIDPANVRSAGTTDLKPLIASIKSCGLLNPLSVRKGADDDTYLVIAGGRRLQALQAIAAEPDMPNDPDIPVQMFDVNDQAAITTISLSENAIREPMSAYQEILAFHDLHEAGWGIKRIATAYGQTQRLVRQRIKLGDLAPEVLKAFGQDRFDIETLRAFTLGPREQQLAVLERLGNNLNAWAVRQAMKEDKIDLNDRRIKAIGGKKAYVAAGGTFDEDLFSQGHATSYATDIPLIKKLLDAERAKRLKALKDEGWADAIFSDLEPYQRDSSWTFLDPVRRDPKDEEQAKLDALQNEMKELEELVDAGEMEEREANLKYFELERQQDALEKSLFAFTAEQRRESAALLRLDYDGTWTVTGGLQMGQPTKPAERPDEEKPKKDPRQLTQALTTDLTMVKTYALQNEIMEQPHLAFDIMLATLAYTAFNGRNWDENDGATAANISLVTCQKQTTKGKISEAERHSLTLLSELDKRFHRRSPRAILDEILSMPTQAKETLLAQLVALSLNGVVKDTADQTTAKRHANFEQICSVARLDMTAHWSPDSEFFSRTSKPLMLDAITEHAGEEHARRLDKAKKADLAAAATELLDGTSYLPEILQVAVAEDEKQAQAA